MTFTGKSGLEFYIEYRNINTSLTDFEISSNKYKGVLQIGPYKYSVSGKFYDYFAVEDSPISKFTLRGAGTAVLWENFTPTARFPAKTGFPIELYRSKG